MLVWASANMPERAVRMVMAIWMIMRQVSGGRFFFMVGLVELVGIGWLRRRFGFEFECKSTTGGLRSTNGGENIL